MAVLSKKIQGEQDKTQTRIHIKMQLIAVDLNQQLKAKYTSKDHWCHAESEYRDQLEDAQLGENERGSLTWKMTKGASRQSESQTPSTAKKCPTAYYHLITGVSKANTNGT